MPFNASVIIYVFMFFLVYYQVFILLTFFEHKREFSRRSSKKLNLTKNLPTVTILVPVFNEFATVEKTIQSLLNLNYPKEKLFIQIIDDGSTDDTWNLIQRFSTIPNITLYKKENGGKYTALNHGIKHCKTSYIGCLDADSEVDAEALLHIIDKFSDPKVMAVTPAMKIKSPDTFVRVMQNAEYNMGIFLRKIMGLIDAQYVTPGPFSFFRTRVFKQIGDYRHAHNTEDLEMALRMQKNHMRIICADKAVVYTVGPRTLYRLYRQRVRWTGGFIQNAIDYKSMILNPKYGNIGMLILPLTMWAIIGTMFALSYSLFTIISNLLKTINTINTIGWENQVKAIKNNFSYDILPQFNDWLYYHTQGTLLLVLFSLGLIIFAVWQGKKLANVKDSNKMDIVYFIMLYSLISPIWLAKSVYNTLRRRDAAWR